MVFGRLIACINVNVGRTGVFALLCTAHHIAGFHGQAQRSTPTVTALTSLSYRPYGRYLNTILEIIGYFNLLRPPAMPIGTTLKTPPSLRDTSSTNRGGLKSFCSSFILIANAVVFGRENRTLRYWHTRPSAMLINTPLNTPPSQRDTSSINRGGLKSFCSSFILIANAVVFGRANHTLRQWQSKHPCHIDRIGDIPLWFCEIH